MRVRIGVDAWPGFSLAHRRSVLSLLRPSSPGSSCDSPALPRHRSPAPPFFGPLRLVGTVSRPRRRRSRPRVRAELGRGRGSEERGGATEGSEREWGGDAARAWRWRVSQTRRRGRNKRRRLQAAAMMVNIRKAEAKGGSGKWAGGGGAGRWVSPPLEQLPASLVLYLPPPPSACQCSPSSPHSPVPAFPMPWCACKLTTASLHARNRFFFSTPKLRVFVCVCVSAWACVRRLQPRSS